MRQLALFILFFLVCLVSSLNAVPAETASKAQGKAIAIPELEKLWLAREERVKSVTIKWKTKHIYLKGSLFPEELLNTRANFVNPKNLILPPEEHTAEESYSLKVDGKKVWFQNTRDIYAPVTVHQLSGFQ